MNWNTYNVFTFTACRSCVCVWPLFQVTLSQLCTVKLSVRLSLAIVRLHCSPNVPSQSALKYDSWQTVVCVSLSHSLVTWATWPDAAAFYQAVCRAGVTVRSQLRRRALWPRRSDRLLSARRGGPLSGRRPARSALRLTRTPGGPRPPSVTE